MDTCKLASLALFRELYNNGKDAYSVLACFIQHLLDTKKQSEFTVTEIRTLLCDNFDFTLPDAIVEYTIRKRLNLRKNIHHKYQYDITLVSTKNDMIDKIAKTEKVAEAILSEVYKYYQELLKTEVTPQIQERLSASLYNFLIDKNDAYSHIISGLIVRQEHNADFLALIEKMREGVLLYYGIKYTAPDRPMGVWKTPMTLYLDVEILFSAYGYNGDLHQQLFNEFYSLVELANKHHDKPIICLKFFEDTKIEINSYFNAAKDIVKYHKAIDLGKSAMPKIIDGCEVASDVQDKYSLFYKFLEDKKIFEETGMSYYSSQFYGYLLDDQEIIDYYAKKYETAENTESILKLLNYINIRRKGVNDKYFDDIGYVLLTEKRLTMDMVVDDKMKAIAPTFLATNLHFITNRLWFKLNVGFGRNDLPKSFNSVATAQIILSAQINNSISKSYKTIQKEVENGTKTEDEIRAMYIGYRKELKSPEDINKEAIDDVLSTILSDDNIEKYLREHDLLKKRLSDSEKDKKQMNNTIQRLSVEIEQLKNTYEERERKENEKLANESRVIHISRRCAKLKKMRCKKRQYRMMYVLFVISIIVALYWLVSQFLDYNTMALIIAIVSVIITIVLGIGIKNIKKFFIVPTHQS